MFSAANRWASECLAAGPRLVSVLHFISVYFRSCRIDVRDDRFEHYPQRDVEFKCYIHWFLLVHIADQDVRLRRSEPDLVEIDESGIIIWLFRQAVHILSTDGQGLLPGFHFVVGHHVLYAGEDLHTVARYLPAIRAGRIGLVHGIFPAPSADLATNHQCWEVIGSGSAIGTDRWMFEVSYPFMPASGTPDLPGVGTVPNGGMAAGARFGIGIGFANFPYMVAHLAYVEVPHFLGGFPGGRIGVPVLMCHSDQTRHALLKSTLVQMLIPNWSIHPYISRGV